MMPFKVMKQRKQPLCKAGEFGIYPIFLYLTGVSFSNAIAYPPAGLGVHCQGLSLTPGNIIAMQVNITAPCSTPITSERTTSLLSISASHTLYKPIVGLSLREIHIRLFSVQPSPRFSILSNLIDSLHFKYAYSNLLEIRDSIV